MVPDSAELARAAWAQVWQVTVLILLVALSVRLLARNRPHLAHVLWLVVLIKCVTPPVWSSTGGVFCWMQSRRCDAAAGVVFPALRSAATQVAVGPRDCGDCGDSACTAAQAVPWVESRTGWAIPVLLAAWMLGTIGVGGMSTARWLLYLRRIRPRGTGCASGTRDSPLQQLVASLSRRLGLRRPARLLVTKGLVGPAMIGLFRPTVLLPEVVARGKSPAELEPILAHELLHFRRGDTWVGVLQMVTQAVWWFHPLVWWAGRCASLEAERCCDEAVLAELGCRPARYAQCLFDVLKQKQTLKPLPAFPGAGPLEATSKRLERIMRLGQGSRKHSPWWCWAVMALAAAVTLPGAALVVRADNNGAAAEQPAAAPRDLQPLRPIGAGTTQQPLPTAARQQPTIVQSPPTTKTYRVDDLLAALRSQHHLSNEEARQYLSRFLLGQSVQPEADSADRRVAWSDKDDTVHITVRAEPHVHSRIANMLEVLRTNGCVFEEVLIEVHFVRAPVEMTESLGINWAVYSTEVPGGADTPEQALRALRGPDIHPERATGTADATQPLQGPARVVVQKNLPLTFVVLDQRQATEVRDRIQDDPRANILAAPKVVTLSGQSATVCDCSQSPFVVGVEDGKPQIRVVSEGSSIRVCPLLLRDEGSIRLHYQMTLSNIRKVDTTTIAGSRDGESLTLQVPQVETTCVDSCVQLPLGSAVLIGGLKQKGPSGKQESLLVMLRATVRPEKSQT